MSRMNFQSQENNVVELENQFILRLPEEPAQALREALRSGVTNVKDRLKVKLEPEKGSGNPHLRRGTVSFDGWEMSATLMDLPTIIESMKSIDKKTFYKTADICQILVCKDGEPEPEEPEDPDKNKNKRKDPNKVDKKFLWRHGLTPPLKNCRRRRFRKTLKKKCVELPEIEKEVKRLLRVDNEAIQFKYELVTEEELNAGKGDSNDASNLPGMTGEESNTVNDQDLFGILSSDEEDNVSSQPQRMDIDSEGDTNTNTAFESESQNVSQSQNQDSQYLQKPVVTQFSQDMFQSSSSSSLTPDFTSSSSLSSGVSSMKNVVASKLESLGREISDLKRRKEELEKNIETCNNVSLLKTSKEALVNVETELIQKEAEMEDLSMF